MAREDINRITRELEDLLMDKKTTVPGWESGEGKGHLAKGQQEAGEGQAEGRLAGEGQALIARDGMTEEEKTEEEEQMVQMLSGEEWEEEETEEEWEEWGQEEEEETAGRRSRRREGTAQPWSLVRPGDSLVVAFFAPVVIMLIIFAQRGIYPFGEESFLRTDMYHQYAPFFSEFRHKLANGESLLYSWNVGMGVNFSALYAYYLASPLNWFLFFCPAGLVIEFMTYMIVAKTGLCGLSMTYYLRKHCRTSDFGTAFFGVFYALSGYMAAYSWNIMWLDCIILFPLIMLGLERLVREGKGGWYCLALGLSILSNYYISIMTCIFMVLYFAALLVLEKEMAWKKILGRCFLFAFYSLLAGGLAAVVLLPEMYALMMTASAKFKFPELQDPYFSIIDMIARHIGNVESEIGLDHWPNIYCGVAVLMFLPLYMAARRISGKEKAVYSVMLLLFFASFSVNILNFIWHGFHFPNSLPCRQSYIYIFLVLVMCCKAYLHLPETPWRHVLLAFWGAVGFVVLAQKLVMEKHFHFSVYYVALMYLALYLWVLWLYYKGARYQNRAVLCALALVSIEAAVNMTVTSVTTTSRTAYVRDNEDVKALAEQVLLSSGRDGFFRLEKVTRKTKNDGAWMNFPSVSLFSSTANADLTKLFKKLGCESSTNAYSITGSTPLVDMLFAVKYGIYSEEPVDTGMREFVARENDTVLYENRYTLPLGFFVPAGFEEGWDRELGNPADVQNSLAACLGAEPVLVMELDVAQSGKELSFTPQESGEYYAYVGDSKMEKVTAETWRGSKTYNHVDRGYLLELGYCTAQDKVTLTAEKSQDAVWADIYRFSETGLAQACEKLSAVPWRLSSWEQTRLEGEVSATEEGTLLTTIPYDEGWKVTVDGEAVPAEKCLDAFIGVPLGQGEHTIVMAYRPKGLTEGAWVTAGCVLLLAVLETCRRFGRPKRKEAEG
ncbi:hypothetical protein D3Z51_15925 [Clostridiaceae bacterium]|nr:hypothetical protein [Clostridiaceae bacterium]RKI10565.1 hypothetical protein D7V81_15390 [bacterium 1XD21-70]